MSATRQDPHLSVVPDPPSQAGSSGGSGGGTEARLAAVEAQVAALNVRAEYLATKEDIQKLKVWVLSGVIFSAIAVISAIATFIIRFVLK